jgi:hypothetical protein
MENLEVSTEMPASTSAPEASATPENVTANPVGESAVAASATPDALAAPVAPAYQPNFKYSVRGQEKEIDEMFRSLVKDAESEKKIKELFEKAEGIDFVKQDRTALKTEFEGFKTQVVPYLQEYHKFTSLRDQGNIGAALSVAGISDEAVFKYALEKLEMEQNPQIASVYKSNQDAALKQFEMQTQLQQYEQMSQQLQQQQFEYDMSQALGSHKDLVSQVDARLGKPGAFREEVERLGIAEYHRGNDLPVQQAVELVANKYKPFFTTNDAPSAPMQTPGQAPQSRQAPAVIPNTGSSNVSVINRKPKSIDDIRKIRSEAVG